MRFFWISGVCKHVLLDGGGDLPGVWAVSDQYWRLKCDFSAFLRYFAVFWPNFCLILALEGRVFGPLEGQNRRKSAKKRIFGYQNLVLMRFGKIDFSSIFDRFWPSRPQFRPPPYPQFWTKNPKKWELGPFSGVFDPTNRFSSLSCFEIWVKPYTFLKNRFFRFFGHFEPI